MDAILTRVGVSTAELRAHCLTAVRDEMQQAEKRLLRALKALERALQVAEAARELHRSPLALVDASADVTSVLARVVGSCNDVGPLVRKLHHAVNAPGVAAVAEEDAASSATEDEAEGHEIIDFVDERNEPDPEPTATGAADDGELGTQALRHQAECAVPNANDEVAARTSSRSVDESGPSTPTPQPRGVCRVIRPFVRERRTRTQPSPPRRPSSRKRKAPERYLDPLSLPPTKKLTPREGLEKRLLLAPQGEFGSVVHSCLLAARDSLFQTGINCLQETCHTLADAKDRGADVEVYMDDMQAVVTAILPDIVKREIRMERGELRAMLVLLQRLPREFPETAKLQSYIASKYETPAEEVAIIRERLDKMLVEVRGWCRDATYSVTVFEDRLQFVKETMEGLSYEDYEPHWDQTIAELLFRLGCCLQAFEAGWAQNRRYDTIRALLHDMKSPRGRRR
ncbi:uncharacterized protein IUM83_00081 [Phytophthora cinnamomi]|uniref:uncharacterized protein n=1 Tax=Phytophthora cinnamomi TaxID=4785 RepID=UPI00355A2AE8|nr:hypothetical protein IUM83_00081 [Phytophthora cinnamomi]